MAHFTGESDALRPAPDLVTDLGTQLEDLITHVFRCEAWERVEDRIDLAVKILPDQRNQGSPAAS